MSAGWVLLLVFFALLVVNTPVSFAMLGASIVTLLYLGEPLIEIARTGYTASAKFPLWPPCLLHAGGALMNSSGISDRIIRFSQALVGWLPGGLSMIAIVAAMIFGAISGEGTAATAAIGTIMIPAMVAPLRPPTIAPPWSPPQAPSWW
ncbi:TRAP transporter large permease subunit [bacterium]|nr:TRAP transporter large permease subunit [bacterium]